MRKFLNKSRRFDKSFWFFGNDQLIRVILFVIYFLLFFWHKIQALIDLEISHEELKTTVEEEENNRRLKKENVKKQ